MDHLSSIDASFLHLETPETPMHVGSLALLQLPKGYKGSYEEELRTMIGERLHLARVLTRKLAPMPFELSEPVWIDDDDIDLDYHVRGLTLRAPGTMEQLHQLLTRLHSTLLDRSRPLWEMYVIEGLQSGQVAFYFKAHHSGVDGKSGMEMFKVLYDTTPAVREVRPPSKRRGNGGGYQLGVAELAQAALSHSVAQYRKFAELLPSTAKALSTAARVWARQQKEKGKRPLNLGLAPKTPFNDSITNQRSYSTMSLPFDEVKRLGKRAGGTVNTVVMAMCSSALRRFLKERGLLPKKPLIAAVPVSLRAEGDDSMSNQVSMVRVDLATDIEDLQERFQAIHSSSEAGKAVVRELKPALGFDLPVLGTPWVVSGLASLFGRSSLPRRVSPAANVTISNVPGPTVPLYICGALMEHFYPMSIPYHGSALNITVHSYAGSLLEFGIVACRRVLSQEESYELMGYLADAVEEIRQLPGVAEHPSETPAEVITAPERIAKPLHAAKPRRGAATAAPAAVQAKAVRSRPAAKTRTARS